MSTLSNNHTNDVVNESISSDKLLLGSHSPSSNPDYNNSTMASDGADESTNDVLLGQQQQQQRTEETPKSLDLEDENNRKPTYNSLKNWVRLASFDKTDLSPAGTTSNSSKNSKSHSVNFEDSPTNIQPDNEDKESRISDGSFGSPTKKTLLWKNDKNKLSLPMLQKDAASSGLRSGRASDATPGQKFLSAAMAVHASVRLSRMERAKRRAKWAGKKLLVFMVSHIGLIFLMLAYATAGGFLFRWLEKDAANARANAMTPVVATTTTTAAAVTPGKAGVAEMTTEALIVPPELEQIRQKYLVSMWNETVSLNVLHPDSWSRSVGKILKEFEVKVLEAAAKIVANATDDDDVVGKPVTTTTPVPRRPVPEEVWTIPASLLFSTTVITSIGYGDITPKTTAGKLVCIPFAIVGIPLTLLCLANIGQMMAGFCRFGWRRVSLCGRMCRKSDEVSKTNNDSKGKTRVPITVSLCIMLGYTLLGALIFSSWEEDWSFIDGFYFSFITLSTIGFGDLVPGQYRKSSNERRVVCVLYLLIGLAMLSMVFQLMIDSVMEVVENVARFMGLSNDQIKEEIEGIDDSAVPTPHLIPPPEPPKPPKPPKHNPKHKLDKSINTSPLSPRKRKDNNVSPVSV